MGIDWETLLDTDGDNIQDAYDTAVDFAWQEEYRDRKYRRGED